ncbi:hypothetical protein NMG60_11027528 [Bertholletia excelsa]
MAEAVEEIMEAYKALPPDPKSKSHKQRKEALQLVELDKMFQTFDKLIQRASELVAGEGGRDSSNPVGEVGRESLTEHRDFHEHKVGGLKVQRLVRSSSAKAEVEDGLKMVTLQRRGNAEELSLIQVAAMIETSAKNSVKILDLQGKLMDKIEWPPESLEKLTNTHELNLPENRITDIPSDIVNLRALTKLDAHSNRLTSMPDSFGDLVNLTHLDIHANNLHALPSSFSNLTYPIDLDLSSNHLTKLPDQMGKLTFLKRLKGETNDIEEIPCTIGRCLALAELGLDFNKINALPETIGKLENYLNELEYVPESLYLATSLVKLNVEKNFADLRALPSVLPDSFRFLSKLKFFRTDETPPEVPQAVGRVAQAAVEYIADLGRKRNLKLQQPNKKKDLSSRVCKLFWNLN